jgi:hypothetical protein
MLEPFRPIIEACHRTVEAARNAQGLIAAHDPLARSHFIAQAQEELRQLNVAVERRVALGLAFFPLRGQWPGGPAGWEIDLRRLLAELQTDATALVQAAVAVPSQPQMGPTGQPDETFLRARELCQQAQDEVARRAERVQQAAEKLTYSFTPEIVGSQQTRPKPEVPATADEPVQQPEAGGPPEPRALGPYGFEPPPPHTLRQVLDLLEGRTRILWRFKMKDASPVGWHPAVMETEAHELPNAETLECLCDGLYDGTGLTAQNVRRLRARLCARLGRSPADVDALTLAEIGELADVKVLAQMTNRLGNPVPPCPGCGSPPAANGNVDDICPQCGEYTFLCGIVELTLLRESSDSGPAVAYQQHAPPRWKQLPPSQARPTSGLGDAPPATKQDNAIGANDTPTLPALATDCDRDAERGLKERLALAELLLHGPNATRIARSIGVPRPTLLGWPKFREHYDRLKQKQQEEKEERRRRLLRGDQDEDEDGDNDQ